LGFISCDLGNNAPQEDVVDEITFIPMISSNEMAKRAGSPPSPYGCVLSTLNPEGSEHLYNYQGFFIKFPPEVYRQARGKTVIRAFHYSSSEVSERTPNFLEKEGTVRFVNCKIPDSDLAIEMLELEFSKFESNSWALDTIQPEKINADETEVFKQQSTTGEWWFECVLTPTGFSIGIYDENDEELYRIYFYDVDCSWVYYEDEGNVGGDSGGGNDPNPPCDNEMDLCFEDPGGGSPVPPPPSDPCEGENPPVYCENPCETQNDHIDAIESQITMENAWAASYGPENNPFPHNQRNEKIFVITDNNGQYNFIEIESTDVSSCHINISGFSLPSNAVGFFHTHPYAPNESITDQRCLDYAGWDVVAQGGYPIYSAGTVSGGDNELSLLTGLPIYVLDKEKIRTIDPLNPGVYSKTDGRCGY
jgi:hypothetical protein